MPKATDNAAAKAVAATTAPAESWDEAPAAAATQTAEAPAPAPAKAEFDGDVQVRCIVNTRPHTHRGPLNHGQEASVPQDVAKIMLKRKQVELV